MMKTMQLTVAVSIALIPTFVVAQAPAEKKAGIEVRDYPGNTALTERGEALKLKGNVRAGQAAYQEYCAACHLPTGGGNPDGSIPQLAGQHSSVVIKQLADIRSGQRYNPTMYPFARKLANPQALADVAAYVQTLCIPPAVLISNSMVLGGEGQDCWMRQVSWCLGRWERGAAA